MYITTVKLNQVDVQWGAENLAYLVKSAYDPKFLAAVQKATPITNLNQIQAGAGQDFRIEYNTLPEYEEMAKQNGLMPDSKANVPRCGYLNVVTIKVNGARVFYAPRNLPQLQTLRI